MAVLELDDVTMEYSRDVRPFNAVDHVSLEIDEGEFVTVVGRSGSGKSTLLNIAAGVLRPTSGRVSICSRDLSGLGDRECSRLRNAHVGYVPQGHGLIQSLTVLENVLLPGTIGGGSASEERALELLDRMGVSELAGSLPRQLSGGEQRRVSIARALINGPKLVVADEPTSDLDSENARTVMGIMRSIRDEGAAVLLVTHESDSTGYGDRICRMDGGRLTPEGA
ncbi:MAG: ABC transporter ATP-binding protein [Thermoplasmata archaeon]|nr:ABC transporter ATP-binding protein [Thermoplasmata archaeon]